MVRPASRRAPRTLMGGLAAFGAVLSFPVHAADVSAVPDRLASANRITWGANASALADPAAADLRSQLKSAPDAPLPPAAQAQIDAMRITREPVAALVVEMDAQGRAANALPDGDAKNAARTAYQQALNDLAREAATRSILRDLYSPAQLQEQMTWFWFNHFNVQAQKRDVRAMVGDYEDTIRSHALGKFRDLLEATLKHPAMLRYLDNDQNAANRINENYAREIMELHSMGVGSGYTQKDVQELARILTGVGVNLKPDTPKLNPQRAALYQRAGLFEFNPNRHDFGEKQFLGHTIKGAGFAEVEQALDLIARSPATAHHVSGQIATYFMGDNPAPALVDRMAATFNRSDGDIAQVLKTMFQSSEYKASLGHAFKDPMHYALSAVRLAYDGQVILNADPILGWLNRMGEGLYAHETPDGYPMASSNWTGPGQMAVRFEIARQIGSGSAGLFKPRGANAIAQPAFPQLQNALYYNGLSKTLSTPTSAALGQANSPQDWNTLFLSSPDFMRR